MFDGKNLGSSRDLVTKLCSYFSELSAEENDEVVIREFLKKVLRKDACHFAEQLKIARLRKNMSQLALSSGLGITQASYSLIETGKRLPSVNVFIECSLILGVDPSVLIHVNDDIPTKSNAIPILDANFFCGAYSQLHRQIEIHSNELKYCRISDASNESFAFKIQGDIVSKLKLRAGRRMPVISGSLAFCTCSGLDYCTKSEEIYSLAHGRLCVVTIKPRAEAMLMEVYFENRVLRLIPWSIYEPIYEFPISDDDVSNVSNPQRMKFYGYDCYASQVEIFGFVTKFITDVKLLGLK